MSEQQDDSNLVAAFDRLMDQVEFALPHGSNMLDTVWIVRDGRYVPLRDMTPEQRCEFFEGMVGG